MTSRHPQNSLEHPLRCPLKINWQVASRLLSDLSVWLYADSTTQKTLTVLGGGLGDIFGRCLGRLLGHTWEVVEKVLEDVATKVQGRCSEVRKYLRNLCSWFSYMYIYIDRYTHLLKLIEKTMFLWEAVYKIPAGFQSTSSPPSPSTRHLGSPLPKFSPNHYSSPSHPGPAQPRLYTTPPLKICLVSIGFSTLT